jgi:hypothetical protein
MGSAGQLVALTILHLHHFQNSGYANALPLKYRIFVSIAER